MSNNLSPNTLIEVNNLIKKIKNKKILDIKSLTINKKNRIVIFAPPKSGKTTLCQTLAGLKKYNSGSLIIKDKIRISLETAENYYSEITSGYDYIKLYLNNYHIDLKSTILYSYIKELDLWNVIDKPISTLTFTQKQKMNILLSIIIKSDLIILDELTEFLDKETKKTIFKLLNNYYTNNDVSYIIVTNNFKDIEKIADTLLILYNGRIIENINMQVLINNYSTVKNFISTQFLEYDKLKLNNKKNFSWKEEINQDWLRRWENENEKRKSRSNKYK